MVAGRAAQRIRRAFAGEHGIGTGHRALRRPVGRAPRLRLEREQHACHQHQRARNDVDEAAQSRDLTLERSDDAVRGGHPSSIGRCKRFVKAKGWANPRTHVD